MDVLDPTGDKIGSISDIVGVQAYSAKDAQTGYTDLTSTGSPSPSGEQTYLKVSQGGVLGIGATDLYIPYNDIQNIVPGESITVNCTKDTCGAMYGTKPDFLP
jgi:hypothetical protein